jgi:hypothetical protein
MLPNLHILGDFMLIRQHLVAVDLGHEWGFRWNLQIKSRISRKLLSSWIQICMITQFSLYKQGIREKRNWNWNWGLGPERSSSNVEPLGFDIVTNAVERAGNSHQWKYLWMLSLIVTSCLGKKKWVDSIKVPNFKSITVPSVNLESGSGTPDSTINSLETPPQMNDLHSEKDTYAPSPDVHMIISCDPQNKTDDSKLQLAEESSPK